MSDFRPGFDAAYANPDDPENRALAHRRQLFFVAMSRRTPEALEDLRDMVLRDRCAPPAAGRPRRLPAEGLRDRQSLRLPRLDEQLARSWAQHLVPRRAFLSSHDLGVDLTAARSSFTLTHGVSSLLLSRKRLRCFLNRQDTPPSLSRSSTTFGYISLVSSAP